MFRKKFNKQQLQRICFKLLYTSNCPPSASEHSSSHRLNSEDFWKVEWRSGMIRIPLLILSYRGCTIPVADTVYEHYYIDIFCNRKTTKHCERYGGSKEIKSKI